MLNKTLQKGNVLLYLQHIGYNKSYIIKTPPNINRQTAKTLPFMLN